MDIKQSDSKAPEVKKVISPAKGRGKWRPIFAAICLIAIVFGARSNLLPIKVNPQEEWLEAWQSLWSRWKPTLDAACHNFIPGCPPPSYQRPDPPYWSKTNFDWDSITPSPKLEYSPCFRNHYCARLEVSLDWNSTDPDGPKAAIAIIKRPAIVDVTDPDYGGAILLNPGGPGGSGVFFLLAAGSALQYIVDSRREEDFNSGGNIIYHGNAREKTRSAETKDARYFDLIGFDPRGVNNTTPSVPGITEPERAHLWQQKLADIGGSFENEEVFSQVYDLRGLYGRIVASQQAEINEKEYPRVHGFFVNHEEPKLYGYDHPTAKFVTTASVVRDMVEIVERHGEWRAEAAKRIVERSKRQHSSTVGAETSYEEALKRTAWRKGKEELQYWGFSYGTVIGQTFATLYPERVGRMVLDGVVNITDYYAGGWKTDLTDTEQINVNFTRECAAAGVSNCKFAEAQQKEDRELLDRFYELLASLKTSPITGLVNENPVLVSQYLILSDLFILWYGGYFGYMGADSVLWEVSQHNAAFFSQIDRPFRCDKDSSGPIRDPYAGAVAILCADSDSKVNQTKEEYQEYIDFVNKLSPTFGNVLAPIMMPCHQFNLKPSYRFTGPFGAETANPILFASQTLDPVTPLRSADGASALFPGSQVLEAQGIGHSTLGYPNLCAAKAIREYFRTGKVPEERTYCAPGIAPFQRPETLLQAVSDAPTLADRYALAGAVETAAIWPLEKRMQKHVELPNWEEAYWHDRERDMICGNPLIEHAETIRVQYGHSRH